MQQVDELLKLEWMQTRVLPVFVTNTIPRMTSNKVMCTRCGHQLSRVADVMELHLATHPNIPMTTLELAES